MHSRRRTADTLEYALHASQILNPQAESDLILFNFSDRVTKGLEWLLSRRLPNKGWDNQNTGRAILALQLANVAKGHWSKYGGVEAKLSIKQMENEVLAALAGLVYLSILIKPYISNSSMLFLTSIIVSIGIVKWRSSTTQLYFPT